MLSKMNEILENESNVLKKNKENEVNNLVKSFEGVELKKNEEIKKLKALLKREKS